MTVSVLSEDRVKAPSTGVTPSVEVNAPVEITARPTSAALEQTSFTYVGGARGATQSQDPELVIAQLESKLEKDRHGFAHWALGRFFNKEESKAVTALEEVKRLRHELEQAGVRSPESNADFSAKLQAAQDAVNGFHAKKGFVTSIASTVGVAVATTAACFLMPVVIPAAAGALLGASAAASATAFVGSFFGMAACGAATSFVSRFAINRLLMGDSYTAKEVARDGLGACIDGASMGAAGLVMRFVAVRAASFFGEELVSSSVLGRLFIRGVVDGGVSGGAGSGVMNLLHEGLDERTWRNDQGQLTPASIVSGSYHLVKDTFVSVVNGIWIGAITGLALEGSGTIWDTLWGRMKLPLLPKGKAQIAPEPTSPTSVNQPVVQEVAPAPVTDSPVLQTAPSPNELDRVGRYSLEDLLGQGPPNSPAVREAQLRGPEDFFRHGAERGTIPGPSGEIPLTPAQRASFAQASDELERAVARASLLDDAGQGSMLNRSEHGVAVLDSPEPQSAVEMPHMGTHDSLPGDAQVLSETELERMLGLEIKTEAPTSAPEPKTGAKPTENIDEQTLVAPRESQATVESPEAAPKSSAHPEEKVQSTAESEAQQPKKASKTSDEPSAKNEEEVNSGRKTEKTTSSSC